MSQTPLEKVQALMPNPDSASKLAAVNALKTRIELLKGDVTAVNQTFLNMEIQERLISGSKVMQEDEKAVIQAVDADITACLATAKAQLITALAKVSEALEGLD